MTYIAKISVFNLHLLKLTFSCSTVTEDKCKTESMASLQYELISTAVILILYIHGIRCSMCSNTRHLRRKGDIESNIEKIKHIARIKQEILGKLNITNRPRQPGSRSRYCGSGHGADVMVNEQPPVTSYSEDTYEKDNFITFSEPVGKLLMSYLFLSIKSRWIYLLL